MFKAHALLMAGAVLATAGVAHAQESAPAGQGDVPWYQRFTTSTGLTGAITGEPEADRLPQPAWSLNQRWGVTVDLSEGERLDLAREPVRPQDEASVGAYYQFTPRVRLGGEVSLGAVPRTQSAARPRDEEPVAGVRIESAFRF